MTEAGIRPKVSSLDQTFFNKKELSFCDMNFSSALSDLENDLDETVSELEDAIDRVEY